MARSLLKTMLVAVLSWCFAGCTPPAEPISTFTEAPTLYVTESSTQPEVDSTVEPSPTISPVPTVEELPDPQGMLIFSSQTEHENVGVSFFLLNVSCATSSEGCIGAERVLMDGSDGALNREFSTSPDGQRIAFRSDRDRLRVSDLYLIRSDGSDLTRLTDTADISEMLPAWSPDGTSIAYIERPISESASRIALLSLDTGERIYLPQDHAFAWLPTWSPDGSVIAYFSHDEDTEGSWITIVDLDTMTARQLLEDPIVFEYGVPATFSSDGSYLIFTANIEGQEDIAVLDTETGEMLIVTNDESLNLYPTCSPDRSQIAYTCLHRDGQTGICIKPFIPEDPLEGDVLEIPGGVPVWSPDYGPYLIVRHPVEGSDDVELFLYCLETDTLTQITDTYFLQQDIPQWWIPVDP